MTSFTKNLQTPTKNILSADKMTGRSV